MNLLLKHEFRKKNAFCLVVALVCCVFFFLGTKREWLFPEINQLDSAGIAGSLVVVLIVSYLGTWLTWSVVFSIHKSVTQGREKRKLLERHKNRITSKLEHLSPQQQYLLSRFIDENRTYLNGHELGGFEAAWKPDMDILVNQQIVKRHRRGQYELVRIYYDHLVENDQG